MMGRKSKAGRNVNPPFLLEAKDVKSLRRGNPLFGGQAGRGHTSQPLGAGRHAGRQAGRHASRHASRQASRREGKARQAAT